MSAPAETIDRTPAPSADGRRRPGEIVADKYRVDDVLGAGGMGVVYRATNLLTHKRVAIKTILPQFAADAGVAGRFVREAQAAGRIDHPSIINVFDVGHDRGVPFLVMELLAGCPLTSALALGRLPPDVAIELLMPAIRGVAAAHGKGIVHRDLKPDNVFLCLDGDGRIVGGKVLDFGISKVKAAADEAGSLTRTGAIVGTPHYMSPEQMRGHRDVDHRTDVYSLGVILYEALTGRPPFVAESFTALAIEIATAALPSVRTFAPEIDPALEDVVARALSRDRDGRFPDAESLGRALEPFGRGARFADPSTSQPISIGLRGVDETAPTIDVASIPPPAPAAQPAVAVVTGERAIAPVMHTSGVDVAPSSRRGPWIAIAAVAAAVLVAVLAVAWMSGDDAPAAPPAPEASPVAGTPAPAPAAPVAAPVSAPVSAPASAPEPTSAAATPEPSPAAEATRPTTRRTGRAPAPTTTTPAPAPTPSGMTARTGRISVDEF